MDKIEHYRECVCQLINAYASYSHDQSLTLTAWVDPDRDHYGVLEYGWLNGIYHHHIMMHLQIINEKVWLHYNATDRQLGEELVGLGVLREDIILGFRPAHLRLHTAFGVG